MPARLPLTGTPRAQVGRRSALLASWMTDFLRGTVSADDAVFAIIGSDEPHVVDGLQVGTGLAALLADLRARGAAGLRLVLPVPGDPRGLPGPGPLSKAALEVGEAVRVQGGTSGYGLVPAVTEHGNAIDGTVGVVRWQVFRCEPATPDPAGTRRQAEHDLADALRTATATLTSLDVARMAPDTAATLAQVRPGRPAIALPPGHPGGSLWAQADRLAAIVDLAAADDGAAYDRTGALHRRDVLRELAAAARRAKTAAVNARLDLPAEGGA